MMLEEAIVSGFISKIINDLTDITIDKVKKADNDRKNGTQSFETRIYQVIIDAINEFTYGKYKNQDILYYAAENIVNGFKDDEEDNIVAIKTGLNSLISSLNDTESERFIKVLYYEICKEDNFDVYKEVVLINQEQETKYNHEVLQRMDKKIDYLSENVTEKNRNFLQNDNLKNNNIKQKVKSRTQEYLNKWNENMFLNNFDKRDENAGVNVKLSEVYFEEHLPHYIWGTNLKPCTDLKKLLIEYIIENTRKKMLLILGQSGIGKSTLITWIIANFKNNMSEMLVYQFASDLKNINWNSIDILDQILKSLNLKYNELENKTLILDGLDEISLSGKSEEMLNRLYQNLNGLNLIKRFTLIITCRENYVWELQKIECNYITLQTWDSEQIRSFCKIYAKKNASTISTSTIRMILEKKEILGTPLILYMALALNITSLENSSIVDIYDNIFSLEGGSLYDRCINNSKINSLRYADPHRISEFKQQIHEISKRIAFWMFENEPEEVYIPQAEYGKICDNVIMDTKEKSEEIKRDFLIGNYFKLTKHVEETRIGRLYFVHRSIYEYFMADYIFKSICDMTSCERIAGEFGKILKKGNLSKQILEFVKYKFENYEKGNVLNDVMLVFKIMLQDGMTYYTKEIYKKVIDKEVSIFSNMLKIVYLWNRVLGELDRGVIDYLRYNTQSELKLDGIRLENVNLNRVYLENAYMSGAELNGIDLQEACLNGVKLIGAYLRKALLNGAKMNNADLSKADLIGAKLNRVHLNGADLIGTRLINAELKGAELNGAKLNWAELNGADLRGAEVDGIELEGAYLREAIFDERQVVVLEKKYDLSNSKIYVYQNNMIVSYKDYYK